MTLEEINNMKYKVCCPLCDNDKCVRGTDKCEAELWKKRRMKQMTEEDKLYADELRNKAISDYERFDLAINELEQQPITWIVGKDNCQVAVRNMPIDKMQKICAIIGEEEQQPSREWKEIYAESEGSNSWIEFKCPHCGYSFGMESGEYDWHYGDEIPWKYCPICGGSAEHKPYKAESEE